MSRDAASQAQVDSADPQRSTWLSANAGSGKTRVLTDRVARLLLEGVEPQNILCLTYTKAAASEMQNRLFKRLGSWAMLDEAKLRAELLSLGATHLPDLGTARTLFARAIETPGGLKIQTIHSFCSSILRRFPLEAGVSPQFREIEDRESELLREDVLDTMARGPDAERVKSVLRHLGGSDLVALAEEVMKKADAFTAGWDEQAMRRMLELRPADTLDGLMDELFSQDNVEIIRDAIAAMKTGIKTDVGNAAKLEAVNLVQPGRGDYMTAKDLFVYGPGTKTAPNEAKTDRFPTKATREAHPELTEALHDLMRLFEQTQQTMLSLMALDRAHVLHAFAARFIPLYRARKVTAGVLDFDDLITRTRDLLTDQRVAQWVLFRLDGGIDHVLVDEAQDTSPAQWEVVRLLTEEFAAGIGARSDVDRTVFVVGDKKQSIYSFQGADPEAFDRMRAHFRREMDEAGKTLQERDLLYSFRSSGAILRVVDETFRGDLAEGLGDVQHLAFKTDLPGRVDLWPVIRKSDTLADPPPWDSPVDEVAEDAPEVQLANRIATEIVRMKREETIPVETDAGVRSRPVTEGDILILVRSRKTLFHELIRACKAAGLDIAGADRLEVGAELAVKDIKALLAFLALPEDDLSLAAVLRSPLFGWTEQDLYTLAHHRTEKYLWAALRKSENHPDTLRILTDMRREADFLRPFDLIERLLTRHEGRKRLIARLGPEAEDGIDALLAQALSYETTAVPSLTSFLAWLETDALEVKRQMDAQGNRIRVMTMHGAKGLEAPIVFLPQTAQRKDTLRGPLLASPAGPLWKSNAAETPDPVAGLVDAEREAQQRESMRLLYVAMTRAEKWLIVAGAGETGDALTDSWYNTVENGMEHAGAVDAMAGDLAIRRVATSGLTWDLPRIDASASPSAPPLPTPTFAPLEPVPPKTTLAPSDLEGAKILPGDPAGEDRDVALARGRIIHRLLEHLAPLRVAERRDLAAALIAADPDADAATPDLLEDVLAVLAAPDLAPLFGPDTLAEVGITAALPALHGRRIHGAIDRLIVTDDRVLAVDYKTNRLVPERAEDTPDGLLRQMGAYAAALAQIYPDRRIETAILWTQTARLMPLPADLTAAALSRVPPP